MDIDTQDTSTTSEYDEKIADLNKDKNLSDKSNIHPYFKSDDEPKERGIRIEDELVVRRGGNPYGNRGSLKTKVQLRVVYRYMNSMVNYVMGLNPALKYDDILVNGLDELNKDEVVLGYVGKLGELRKDCSICTSSRFSSWDSRDEDFYFLDEVPEKYNVTYSADNDIRIGNLSHDLKLHKHKLIGVALNYGIKPFLEKYGCTKNEIYNRICDEISWFRDEYTIKTVVLQMRFQKLSKSESHPEATTFSRIEPA